MISSFTEEDLKESEDKYRSLVGANCAAIEVDYNDTFDLDYPEDFEICEIVMKKRSRL